MRCRRGRELTASYTTGLQTDLGELQGQLDLASLTENGQAVDALTGAPLFTGFNGLGAQTGLYRAKNFDASISTSLDRDDYALTFPMEPADNDCDSRTGRRR